MSYPAEELERQPEPVRAAEAVLGRVAQAHVTAQADVRHSARALAESEEHEPEAADEVERERRRSQALLRKAEARYRALVEQIPAVTFMAPLDGTTDQWYVSPQIEQLLGFTAEEWVNNPLLWYQQLHPEDQSRWQDMFAGTANSAEHFRSDYRFISRDGRIVWVHGEAKVVKDEEGRPLFLQGVAFDITESKQAEENMRKVNARLALARDQALEASRAKSSFLANMSHELRTPLNAILGFSEMLQEDASDTGQASFLPDLEKIHGSAKHLLGLIGGILDLSKIEAGKMDVFLETFDLNTLIQDVLTTVRPLVTQNGNTLEVRCPDDLGAMHADVPKVRQVLLNLLSNAGKFTANGCVTLEAARLPAPDGEYVCIAVKDTGIGIPPDKMGQLFQVFNQGDNSTTRKYGGTGLGLAISQRFCQLMGGSIAVHSEVGKGSTFTMKLPVEVVPVQDELPPPSEEAAWKEEGDRRKAEEGQDLSDASLQTAPILLIDDDAQVRELMSRFLTKEGFSVLTAASGAEGIRLAQDAQPAAITLAMALGDMDGWQVLTELKAVPALAAVPVILFATADDASRCYALGVGDYLTKPIDWGCLAAVLQKYHGQKPPGRLLIVDDEQTNREMLRRMAAKEGWTVAEADNGRTALKAVAEARPDLILLDLMMPEMDGFELVRLLRKTQAGRTIPVVIVTAKERTPDDRRQLCGSVHRILQKGAFSRDEMLQEVRGLVAAGVRCRTNGQPEVRNGHGPALPEVQRLRDLQRQIEQLTGERDAALALARLGPTDGEEWATRERHWEEESEVTRHQLREQQQTVALLQAECEEAWAQAKTPTARAKLEDETVRHQLREQQQAVELLQMEYAEARAQLAVLGEVHKQLEQVRAERDAALSQVRALSEGAPPSSAKERARQRRLHKEVKTLRLHQREAQRQLEQLHAERAPVQEPGRGTDAAAPTDVWHVVYHDEKGQTYRGSANTKTLRQWLQKEGASKAAILVAGRTPHGPFEPLSNCPEFRDLVPPASASPATLPVARPAAEESEAPDIPAAFWFLRRWLPDWAIRHLPIFLAVVGALLLGMFLFRK